MLYQQSIISGFISIIGLLTSNTYLTVIKQSYKVKVTFGVCGQRCDTHMLVTPDFFEKYCAKALKSNLLNNNNTQQHQQQQEWSPQEDLMLTGSIQELASR